MEYTGFDLTKLSYYNKEEYNDLCEFLNKDTSCIRVYDFYSVEEKFRKYFPFCGGDEDWFIIVPKKSFYKDRLEILINSYSYSYEDCDKYTFEEVIVVILDH